jgi:hypothetical protein
MVNKCFLCGKNGQQDRLEKHHIFGGANRKKSEKYGLYVFLCGNECHRNGKYAVHKNKDTMLFLHKYGQQKAMEEQVWTIDKFIEEFGKNYMEV